MVIGELVPGYHTPGMAGLQMDLQVLNELLAEELPAVKTALTTLCVPLELVAMEHLVGLFCTSLPRHTLYLLWDTLFFEGSATLLAAMVELFDQCSVDILGATSME